MKEYILLYGDKKLEDNIIIKNMFENNKQISLGWTDFDYTKNMEIIEEIISLGTKQLIFMGLEIGWNKLIKDLKEKYSDIKIKVICNTLDSLLYYEYERDNFFELLRLSKEKIVDNIGFLRKGQYQLYNSLGYQCSYIMQNYILDSEILKEKKHEKKDNQIQIGVYPLNYTWDKNIFNQLCISKYIENSILKYNMLDERMKDFVDTMEIKSSIDKVVEIKELEILDKVSKNDINISLSFTEYLHTVFFLSMEQGIPCLIGNNSELFSGEDEIRNYVVSSYEDDNIKNSKLVKNCLENVDKIMELYSDWKHKYNEEAKLNLEAFIEG